MAAAVRILRAGGIPQENRKSILTSRGVAKRQREEPNVWQHRVHPSTSLELSRKWFAKQIAEQMQRGGLFTDPFMEASHVTIGSTRGRHQWLRPHEIVSNPQFVSDGISRFDVRQGELGNCWFLAAVACLSMHPELLEQVVCCSTALLPTPAPSSPGSPKKGTIASQVPASFAAHLSLSPELMNANEGRRSE
ncbi:unnamed protein product [Dicrocoelium dendriticum]|nr:unnamed protein product [Dicrocoelium dendriticum]